MLRGRWRTPVGPLRVRIGYCVAKLCVITLRAIWRTTRWVTFLSLAMLSCATVVDIASRPVFNRYWDPFGYVKFEANDGVSSIDVFVSRDDRLFGGDVDVYSVREFGPDLRVPGFERFFRFVWVRDRYNYRAIYFDVNSYLLLAGMGAWLIWRIVVGRRRHRRERRTGLEPLCARCGYSLIGNTTGACPECGTEHAHEMR